VLDTNLALIAAYTINSGALQEITGSPFPVGTAPFGLAINPSEHFMYVVNEGPTITSTGTVSQFTINATTGFLTPVLDSAIPAGQNPVAVLVHPTGRYLYVANSGSNDISEFSIDSNTGVLTELTSTTVVAGTTPLFMAFDPISGFVDVGNQGSKNITQYSVNLTTGFLNSGVLTAVNTLITNDPPTAIGFSK
jgi:6-phosphogluconolactonase